MVDMETRPANITHHHNLSDFWNDTKYKAPASEHAFTSISFGLGCCITILNASTMYLLIRHRNSISGNGFWHQLVFLCFTDILSGVSISLPYFGYIFIAFNTDIYNSFCSIGLVLFPLSITLSVGNCFIISTLRYMVLKHADKPNVVWNKHTAFLMITGNVFLCILTFISSVMVVTFHFGFQFVVFCEKVNISGQNDYKSKYSVGVAIMLVLFILGTNIFTVLCILKIWSKNRIQPITTSLPNSTSAVNLYATVTFVLIVFVLNVTTLPSLMFVFVSMNKSVKVSAETTEIISRLMSMNSLCNPFIYSLRSSQFRIAVWNDLKAFVRQIRCTSETQ